jgi:hypothetical protein
MLNLGQVTRSHLTQVQHSLVSTIDLTNSSAHMHNAHHDRVSFSFFSFSFLTSHIVPAAMTTQGVSGHHPLPLHLQFAPRSPSQPAHESAIFFSSFSLTFYLPIVPCPLPSPCRCPLPSVSIPSPLCRRPSPHATSTPPPLMSHRPLPPLVSCINTPSPHAASTAPSPLLSIPPPLHQRPSPHATSTPPPLVSCRPLPPLTSCRPPLPSRHVDPPSPRVMSTPPSLASCQ